MCNWEELTGRAGEISPSLHSEFPVLVPRMQCVLTWPTANLAPLKVAFTSANGFQVFWECVASVISAALCSVCEWSWHRKVRPGWAQFVLLIKPSWSTAYGAPMHCWIWLPNASHWWPVGISTMTVWGDAGDAGWCWLWLCNVHQFLCALSKQVQTGAVAITANSRIVYDIKENISLRAESKSCVVLAGRRWCWCFQVVQ